MYVLDVFLDRKSPLLWKDKNARAHTQAPEVVYGICCPWVSLCNCQTRNPAQQIWVNLVKLIHNLIIKSLLITEKSTLRKVSEQVRGNIETRDTGFVRQATCSNQ